MSAPAASAALDSLSVSGSYPASLSSPPSLIPVSPSLPFFDCFPVDSFSSRSSICSDEDFPLSQSQNSTPRHHIKSSSSTNNSLHTNQSSSAVPIISPSRPQIPPGLPSPSPSPPPPLPPASLSLISPSHPSQRQNSRISGLSLSSNHSSPDSRRHSNSVLLHSPPFMIPSNHRTVANLTSTSATNSPSTSPSSSARRLRDRDRDRDSLPAIAPWSLNAPISVNLPLPFACCHSRDGVLIRYSVHGHRYSASPALVFVHGFAGDSTYFSRQLTFFSSRFQCLTLDLAGHGHSGFNRDREKWTIESLADDVRAVVKHANLDRFILIGHSLAGAAVLHAASAMPGKAIGVIGLDSLFVTRFEFPETAVDLVSSLRLNFADTCRSMMNSAFHRLVDPALKEFLLEDMSASNPVIAPLISAHLNFNFAPLFSSIRCPILSLSWGSHNVSSQQVELIRSLVQLPGEYKYVDLGDVGHFMFLTHPEEVNRTIEQWILAITNYQTVSNPNGSNGGQGQLHSPSPATQFSTSQLLSQVYSHSSAVGSSDVSNSSSASASPIPTPRSFLLSRPSVPKIDFDSAVANILSMSRHRSSISIAKPETPSSASTRSETETDNSLTNSPLSAPISISPRLSATPGPGQPMPFSLSLNLGQLNNSSQFHNSIGKPKDLQHSQSQSSSSSSSSQPPKVSRSLTSVSAFRVLPTSGLLNMTKIQNQTQNSTSVQNQNQNQNFIPTNSTAFPSFHPNQNSQASSIASHSTTFNAIQPPPTLISLSSSVPILSSSRSVPPIPVSIAVPPSPISSVRVEFSQSVRSRSPVSASVSEMSRLSIADSEIEPLEQELEPLEHENEEEETSQPNNQTAVNVNGINNGPHVQPESQ